MKIYNTGVTLVVDELQGQGEKFIPQSQCAFEIVNSVLEVIDYSKEATVTYRAFLSSVVDEFDVAVGNEAAIVAYLVPIVGGIPSGGGGGGDLLSTNNLSDVANAGTSLGNLGGEPAFTKNTAFNKNFGTTAGTVLEGDTAVGGGYIQTATLTTASQFTLLLSKAITNDSVQTFVTRITAIKTSTGDVWAHEFRGAIKQFGGVTSIVDTVTDEMIAEDVAASGWSAALEEGTGVLDIKVTSGDVLEIKWKSETVFSEVLI
jgi:hypothetical protein